jgi:hypothetical protein
MDAPNPEPGELVLADAHVHIYGCFDLAEFFESAVSNFTAQARGSRFTALLFLTETARDNWFGQLGEFADNGKGVGDQHAPAWSLHRSEEPESLRVQTPGRPPLWMIAGRQIVTRENLEVLALGTAESFLDGAPLAEVIDRVRAAGAVPVIPWGFGKWLGKRGAVLTRYLESRGSETLFLGDNSGRPSGWPAPVHFKLASQKGIRVLPGSDPLPIPSQAWRPGSYGFHFHGPISVDRPWCSAKTALLDASFAPSAYGARENPYRFVRNQIHMQLLKYRRRH